MDIGADAVDPQVILDAVDSGDSRMIALVLGVLGVAVVLKVAGVKVPFLARAGDVLAKLFRRKKPPV